MTQEELTIIRLRGEMEFLKQLYNQSVMLGMSSGALVLEKDAVLQDTQRQLIEANKKIIELNAGNVIEPDA